MFLRFNEGAIVRLFLLDQTNPSVIGKVVKVFPDEVELCPQLLVYHGKILDRTRTADSIKTIHLRRQLIWNWDYATISDIKKIIPKGNNISNDNNQFCCNGESKEFSKYTFNEFGPDKVCLGNGPYCGNIPESFYNIVLNNFPNNLEDDCK